MGSLGELFVAFFFLASGFVYFGLFLLGWGWGFFWRGVVFLCWFFFSFFFFFLIVFF